MIPFNIPTFTGKEFKYIRQAVANHQISGDGAFTKRCNHWLELECNIPKVFLTTSCTHALEMAAILTNIKPGDEVIAPSYTFVSTVNAFVLRGAKIKFVDIRPDTLNIDDTLIEAAISKHTKAIIVMHYAGIACEMDTIMAISRKYNILVIEDAAHSLMAQYKGRALGSIGDIGAFSFHDTKNYSMGEGGAILLNNTSYLERAEIIREKGTDRSQFFRGEIDKYSWRDIGSSYLPSELNAAYLWAQLELAHKINDNRLQSWDHYYDALSTLTQRGDIELPSVPSHCKHNAHAFYIKASNLKMRTLLIEALQRQSCSAVSHYVPLHTSKAGKLYGEFVGEDKYTTRESERVLRLPLYYGLKPEHIDRVVNAISTFIHNNSKTGNNS